MIKNKLSQRPQSILLSIMVCLLIVFFTSTVSAFTWDNIKSYDEETRTITITNALGLGAVITTSTLESPLNVKVGAGDDKLVGWFTYITTEENVSESFGNLYLEDLKNGNQIFRGGQYKVYLSHNETVDEYETVCENVTDGNITEVCEQVETGSHIEIVWEWKPITNPHIELQPNIKYKIGIFVDVEVDDKGEWIPTFSGKAIPEWASWTANLNVGLVGYWKFDTNANDSYGTNDGSAENGASLTTGSGGVIGEAYILDGTNDYVNITNLGTFGSDISGGEFTFNFFIKTTDQDRNRIMANKDTTEMIELQINAGSNSGLDVNKIAIRIIDADGNILRFYTTADVINLTDGTWKMVTIIADGGSNTGEIYVNGVSQGISYDTQTTADNFIDFNTFFPIGARNTDGVIDEYLNANFDEISIFTRKLTQGDVDFLYNGSTWVSVSYPSIILNSPSSANYTTVQNIQMNFTASDDINLTDVKLYVNDVLNQTNTSGINNTDYLFNLSLGDGDYTIYGKATNNNSQETNSSSVQINIDTLSPQILIESPLEEEDYFLMGNNKTLNVTVTDVNLDSCWYNYNETNTTINGCLTGVKNSTQFLYKLGENNMTVYANDTYGHINSTTILWTHKLIEINQTYPTTSLETATETYTTNVEYNSTKYSVITGILTFNGTEYTGTKTGTADVAKFSTDIIIPSITSETNYTSYWTISLTDNIGTWNQNLTSNNVTVSIINMSLCGSPYNVSFWNYTILNESNEAEINATFDATFNVKLTGSSTVSSFSFADSTGNNSQFDFCISPATESYTINTAIKITKTEFVDKFYDFNGVVVTNTTREDNLYMLTTGDSTSYIVHAVYVDSSDIIGAEIRVQRYYEGSGEWVTTEILTTNDIGEAVGHLLSEDANYRFKVFLNSVSIFNSTSTKITCTIAPCTVTLTIPVDVGSGIETLEDLTSSMTYDDITNTFTYTYSDSSDDFSQARLYVIRYSPSNGTIIVACNETRSTTDGVITCGLTGQLNGTYQANGFITRTGDEVLDKRIYGVRGDNVYNAMGNDGVLWAFFVFIGIIMLGINRPSLSIVFGTIGLILLKLLQIINIGALSVVAVSSIAIILLMRIGRE